MDEWHYEPAHDLDKSLVERLKGFPREPHMWEYGLRSAAMALLRGWLRLYHRFEVTGREHLPLDESFVMVANHSSHLDALCLLSALPLRRLHQAFPAAAADYFFKSIPKLAVAAILINALPFERKARSHQSLNICHELLKSPGNVLILFPEGTRTPTGTMGEFKAGIGLLMAGCAAPVVPCKIHGAYEAWPKGRVMPRPRALRLVIGEPRRFEQAERTKAEAIRIAEELQGAVSDLA